MVDAAKTILIDYTNHVGNRQVRTIVPDEGGIFFGDSYWHPEKQWLLNAFDIGKAAARTFAVKDINRWGVHPDRQMQVDLSIAKQLQESMELNARMKNRLRGLLDNPASSHVVVEDALRRSIENIIADQEPTAWPA